MRALVTGGNGFVGTHLCAALRERGHSVAVAGREECAPGSVDVELDLGDFESIRAALAWARAEVVFHLAAQAFVPEATDDPLGTYDTNVMGTARLFQAIRQTHRDDALPRVIFTSSAEVYGAREPQEYPLHEGLAVRPATPYAASKAAGEAIALAACRTYRIPAIVTRAFNAIGPGQTASFAVPSFAGRLAEIAAGAEPVLPVGNIETARDFIDVRDAVEAYVELAEHGKPGEIYNVCNGQPVTIKEVLRRLIAIARTPVEVREDPARLRPVDVPVSYGSNEKLRAATAWVARYPLERSLRDVYADAQARVALVT